MLNPSTAKTLPNGARILKRAFHSDKGWVWLCRWNGASPYITWASNTESPGETYWGHYFEHYDSAYHDFEKRCSYSILEQICRS